MTRYYVFILMLHHYPLVQPVMILVKLPLLFGIVQRVSNYMSLLKNLSIIKLHLHICMYMILHDDRVIWLSSYRFVHLSFIVAPVSLWGTFKIIPFLLIHKLLNLMYIAHTL